MDNFSKKDWLNFGRWVQPPISGCFWPQWHKAESTKEIFTGREFVPLLFLDGYTLGKVADQNTFDEHFLTLLKNGQLENFVEKFEKVSEKAEKEHLNLLNSTAPTTEYLKELFRTYREV